MTKEGREGSNEYIEYTGFSKKYDFSFFGIAAVIFVIGVVNLYSATHASTSFHMANLYKSQSSFFVIALFAGIIVSFIRPKTFFHYSWILYGVSLSFLVLVLFYGDEGMGARRWLVFGPVRFQPSEIMKISLILILARWYSRVNSDRELGFWDLIIPFILVLIPSVLIIKEPDLGTGLLILFIFFVISFYRRLKWRTMALLVLISALSGAAMYQFGLKPYQRKRVLTFWNPEVDVRGSGYNAIQSKIAIGSGQFFGKGFKNSSQASLNYLPENHTDFVFSIFNEEHGFFGSIFLIGLYLILFRRFIWLANSANQLYESIVAIGIMSVFSGIRLSIWRW